MHESVSFPFFSIYYSKSVDPCLTLILWQNQLYVQATTLVLVETSRSPSPSSYLWSHWCEKWPSSRWSSAAAMRPLEAARDDSNEQAWLARLGEVGWDSTQIFYYLLHARWVMESVAPIQMFMLVYLLLAIGSEDFIHKFLCCIFLQDTLNSWTD